MNTRHGGRGADADDSTDQRFAVYKERISCVAEPIVLVQNIHNFPKEALKGKYV